MRYNVYFQLLLEQDSISIRVEFSTMPNAAVILKRRILLLLVIVSYRNVISLKLFSENLMIYFSVVGYGTDSSTNTAYWLVKLAWGEAIESLFMVSNI